MGGKQTEENIKLKHNFMNDIAHRARQEIPIKMFLHRRMQAT
jgi:hypothetical protein